MILLVLQKMKIYFQTYMHVQLVLKRFGRFWVTNTYMYCLQDKLCIHFVFKLFLCIFLLLHYVQNLCIILLFFIKQKYIFKLNQVPNRFWTLDLQVKSWHCSKFRNLWKPNVFLSYTKFLIFLIIYFKKIKSFDSYVNTTQILRLFLQLNLSFKISLKWNWRAFGGFARPLDPHYWSI